VPRRIHLIALSIILSSGALNAQTTWQPSPGHKQIPIWPGAIPDTRPIKGPEKVEVTGPKDYVAGSPWTSVENVAIPTMTIYSPAKKNIGAAIVVFPGGGYEILAIDLEGTEACDWLTSRGITCVLLKYRVPAPRSAPYWGAYPQSPIALEDAQRTLGLLRLHAAEYHIDPHKIGVLGFSAGGHLVAAVSVHYPQRIYPHIDAADDQSCRPDFAIALYPGHLAVAKNRFELTADIRDRITSQTPPTFLLQNEDDHVDSVEDSLSYFAALKKAGVPTELHVYATGGHAFGLRRTSSPATAWPQLVETWLSTLGITSK
jgi:acetyl esterase/lipase